MFQVLFTALVLLGIAYWVYRKFNPTESKAYKQLESEKLTLEQELKDLKAKQQIENLNNNLTNEN